jgi:hypothetical protein
VIVTLRHIGDTMRFAKFSSDETDDAFKVGEPVIKAWIPFAKIDGAVPDEIEVEVTL